MAALLGYALGRLHAVDVSGSSTDVEFDTVPEADFGYFDSTKASMLAALESRLRLPSRRVLCHGDPCLPNVLVLQDELSGFVDVGSAGLGDPLKDLALALWSLEYNYGGGWSEELLAAYETGIAASLAD